MARKASKAGKVTATAERTTSLGTTIRVVLTPTRHGHVRIVEYYRRRKNETRYARAKGEEGVEVPFELLHLEQSYEELFPQAALFPASAD